MVGPLIVNQGKVVRPSQLIRSVVPTTRGAARGSSPGRGHGARAWGLHEVAAPPPQVFSTYLPVAQPGRPVGWLKGVRGRAVRSAVGLVAAGCLGCSTKLGLLRCRVRLSRIRRPGASQPTWPPDQQDQRRATPYRVA